MFLSLCVILSKLSSVSKIIKELRMKLIGEGQRVIFKRYIPSTVLHVRKVEESEERGWGDKGGEVKGGYSRLP